MSSRCIYYLIGNDQAIGIKQDTPYAYDPIRSLCAIHIKGKIREAKELKPKPKKTLKNKRIKTNR